MKTPRKRHVFLIAGGAGPLALKPGRGACGSLGGRWVGLPTGVGGLGHDLPAVGPARPGRVKGDLVVVGEVYLLAHTERGPELKFSGLAEPQSIPEIELLG